MSGNVNPLKRLREKIKPTPEQLERRSHWRDKKLKRLLQRELAEILMCSDKCVRQAEKESRFPKNPALKRNAVNLYRQLFPNEPIPE